MESSAARAPTEPRPEGAVVWMTNAQPLHRLARRTVCGPTPPYGRGSVWNRRLARGCAVLSLSRSNVLPVSLLGFGVGCVRMIEILT